jgi:hypothetical protein
MQEGMQESSSNRAAIIALAALGVVVVAVAFYFVGRAAANPKAAEEHGFQEGRETEAARYKPGEPGYRRIHRVGYQAGLKAGRESGLRSGEREGAEAGRKVGFTRGDRLRRPGGPRKPDRLADRHVLRRQAPGGRAGRALPGPAAQGDGDQRALRDLRQRPRRRLLEADPQRLGR